MTAQRGQSPSYRLHSPSGQAIVTVAGRTIYLGRYGSPESHESYERVLGEHAARGRYVTEEQSSVGLTVDDLIAGYWTHAEVYYRKDGKPTDKVAAFKVVLRDLRYLYGRTLADEFGPSRLKAVRQQWVEQNTSPTYS